MLARQWLPSLSVLQNAEPHGAHQKMKIFLHNSAQHRCVTDRWTSMEFSFAAL